MTSSEIFHCKSNVDEKIEKVIFMQFWTCQIHIWLRSFISSFLHRSALYHDLDGAVFSGLGCFKGLQCLLQLEPFTNLKTFQLTFVGLNFKISKIWNMFYKKEWPVCDERLDVDLAAGHHGNGLRVAIGVPEDAPHINLPHTRVQYRNLDAWNNGKCHGNVSNLHWNYSVV